MFAKSVKVVLNRAVTPIVAGAVTERTLIQGVGDALTAVYDDDIAVSGIGVPVAFAGAIYLAALGTNRMLTGRFNVNPLSAG